MRRSLKLDDGVECHIERTRVLHFPQALFNFQCTFVSDQKEEELLSAAVDLHYGRQVRHGEKLLDMERLSEQPALPLPEARHIGVAAGYSLARAEVLRTLVTLARTRARELQERLDRQGARMQRYYGDLRSELDHSVRGTDTEEARNRREERKATIGREETLALPNCVRRALCVSSCICSAC